MNKIISGLLIFIVVIISIGIGACDSSVNNPEKNMVDEGSWYETGHKWPHDGRPFESENFIIYSDGASIEARKLLSEICDSSFDIIIEKLAISDLTVMQFPEDRNDKIHIYAYKNYNPTSWGGQAYYGGYMIYSPDHPQRSQSGQTSIEKYSPIVRHELVHVIQNLIIGANDENLVYAWFAEGIAIEISEDVFYDHITTQEMFDEKIATWGNVNPIEMKYSSSYQGDVNFIVSYCYPMFRLAIKYLTDPSGHGKSFNEVRKMLFDVADRVPFEQSFNENFEISYGDFNNQFFNLMDNYLD